MRRAVTLFPDRTDPWLLDPEVWDIPACLTDADLSAHTGPGWRRGDAALDDPEDDR